MRAGAVLFFISFLGAPSPAAWAANVLIYSGEAKARRSENFLYTEKHFLIYQNARLAERVVLYLCQDGTAFARKNVNYSDLTAPDFALEDASNGMREGVRTEGQQRSVFFQANRASPEKQKALPPIAELVGDAGFDEFIRAKWSVLMTGKAVPLQFLVPSRLGAMRFAAQRLRSDTVDGVPAEIIRLKIDGALGLMAPSIDVSYSAADHVLLRYDGVSDLRNAAGQNYQALISFRPEDRGEGAPRAVAAARAAPLAACR
jgi:hypothetical protein